MTEIRLAIADDHQLFNQTLGMLLVTVEDFRLIFSSVDSEELLSQIKAAPLLPHVVLIDIDMPGMNGMELNRLLQKDFPQIRVIMLSVHLEEEIIAKVIHDGAAAYLTKNCDKQELLNTIRIVHREGFHINLLTYKALSQAAQLKSRIPKSAAANLNALSTREKEVLLLICKEYSNVDIAEKLFLSVRTVEGHRNNLLTKTGCRNIAGLVLYAIKHRLIEASF